MNSPGRLDHLPKVLTLGQMIGVVAGLVEGSLAGTETPLRFLSVVGWDGLLGLVISTVLALLTALIPGRSPERARQRLQLALAGLIALPLALLLGILGNRLLLRGAHFMSAKSLLWDLLALGFSSVFGLVAARRFVGRNFTEPTFRRIRFLPALLAASCISFAAAPSLLTVPSPANSTLPPIVLVSLDTLRPDRLSSGGDPRGTSPEIDRLLRQGVQFPEAITVSPGSAASHAALFTSRVPVSNGVFSNFTVMDSSVVTLAELLKDRGYKTAGFATNTFLGQRFGFDQGFDVYIESGVVERARINSPTTFRRGLAVQQVIDRIRARFDPGFDPSFETSLQFIREGHGPVFLFIHLMDVHSPYSPPHPYGPRFGARREGSLAAPTGKTPARKRNRLGWRPSEEAYVAEIRFADRKIQRLRNALEVRGLLEQATLVLTSDHGENLLDHDPPFSHGATLYDATVRVLLGFWGKDVAKGRLIPGQVENTDVLPTLASLLSWPSHEEWEGRSLAEPGERSFPPSTLVSQLNRDFILRSNTTKIVIPEDGLVEKFDLLADPGEVDPEPLPPDLAQIERDRLTEWLLRRSRPLYTNAPKSVKPSELSPEVIEKLRTLGYID